MKKFFLTFFLFFLVFLHFTNVVMGQLQLQDSGKYNKARKLMVIQNENTERYLKPSALIVPTSFLLYGCLKPAIKGIQSFDDNIKAQVLSTYPNFKTNADDYLMWVPSAALYTLKAFNVPTKHNLKEQLIIEAGSIIITGGVGLVMRKISGNMEVYNKQGTKFPSGHTANAFRAAEIFHQELKDTNKVLSYAGYIVAAGVGTFRILNKNHLFTEVIAGAGLGILSTKLTYWIFEKVKYSKVKHI